MKQEETIDSKERCFQLLDKLTSFEAKATAFEAEAKALRQKTERLLTVSTVSFTLKQRSGNLFNFLTRTFEAHLKGGLAPSILDSS